MKINWIAALAALFLALAVAMGAFGAHALKDRLTPYYLQVFEKAVFYHFVHSLGALVLALFVIVKPEYSKLAWVALALLGSTIIFSGSLYLLVLLDQRWLGAITPIGGLGFILSWLSLALLLLF